MTFVVWVVSEGANCSQMFVAGCMVGESEHQAVVLDENSVAKAEGAWLCHLKMIAHVVVCG